MAFEFFNTEELQWKEIVFMLGGANVGKARGFSYSVETDDEALYAAGDEPISIQSGNRKYEGNIKVLKGVVDDLNAAAVAAGGRDITDVKFDVVMTYLPNIGRAMMIDTLVGVKINKLTKAMEQNAKQMDVELPFKFLRLLSVPA